MTQAVCDMLHFNQYNTINVDKVYVGAYEKSNSDRFVRVSICIVREGYWNENISRMIFKESEYYECLEMARGLFGSQKVESEYKVTRFHSCEYCGDYTPIERDGKHVCTKCYNKIESVVHKAISHYKQGERRVVDNAKKQKPCYVYKITDGESVKIGISDNPENRILQLQTSHSKKLSIVRVKKYKTRDEAIAVETRAHKIYSRFRLSGEWFSKN